MATYIKFEEKKFVVLFKLYFNSLEIVTDYIFHRRRQPDFSVHGTGRKVLSVRVWKKLGPAAQARSWLCPSLSADRQRRLFCEKLQMHYNRKSPKICNIIKSSVERSLSLRIPKCSVADPDPWSGAFLTLGRKKNWCLIRDLRWTSKVIFSISEKQFFEVKILKFFYADTDLVSFWLRIWDPVWKNSGLWSGIRHKHPGSATLPKYFSDTLVFTVQCVSWKLCINFQGSSLGYHVGDCVALPFFICM